MTVDNFDGVGDQVEAFLSGEGGLPEANQDSAEDSDVQLEADIAASLEGNVKAKAKAQAEEDPYKRRYDKSDATKDSKQEAIDKRIGKEVARRKQLEDKLNKTSQDYQAEAIKAAQLESLLEMQRQEIGRLHSKLNQFDLLDEREQELQLLKMEKLASQKDQEIRQQFEQRLQDAQSQMEVQTAATQIAEEITEAEQEFPLAERDLIISLMRKNDDLDARTAAKMIHERLMQKAGSVMGTKPQKAAPKTANVRANRTGNTSFSADEEGIESFLKARLGIE